MDSSLDEEDVLALDLVAAGERLRRGDLDAVALTEVYLAQIDRTEPSLNAYVTVDAAGAREAAARAAREIADGRHRGPLHGIPIGVKDLADTAGLTTTYGSARYREHVPRTDARVVTDLRRHGAVILGKHATHEFAWGGRTDGAAYGPTRNPHDPARIPGGSSGGGGASVAARSALAAIGTDTAGSVRIPAALSGCVGLKPTQGWMSLSGVHPLAPSLDVVGMLTRTVRDARLLYGVLAAESTDADQPVTRVALLDDPTETMAAEAAGAVEWACRRLESAGVGVDQVTIPPVAERAIAVLTWVRAEAERVHREGFASTPENYGKDLATLLDLGPVSDRELRDARAVIDLSVRAVRRALRDHPLLLSATVPVPAPLIGELDLLYGGRHTPVEFVLTRLTSIANAAGVPAMSVPAPSAELPVGVQLIGRPHRERDLFAVADLLHAREA